MFLYNCLDIFFLVFHTLIICFNLSGWIWKKTRLANLIILTITAFSWFVLGFWYGFGYCFCVDWHWTVKHKLGEFDLPNSYIKYLLDLMTGLDWNPALVDVLTFACFFTALIVSIFLNVRDWRNKKRSVRTSAG
ncbi:MAG: DUF2784 domain-containing protein [Desulfobacterales bacterium]|nr:DUF2784 domain-containing protein [Desulfobacterales bacterium]